jgi:hypothetical protein
VSASTPPVRSAAAGIFVTSRLGWLGFVFPCPILVSRHTTLSRLAGNVWDDTDQPIGSRSVTTDPYASAARAPD